MPNCRHLVLVPTEAERTLCRASIADLAGLNDVSIELCGWGPVHSAILSTRLIQEHRPNHVWLVGIAGLLYQSNSTHAIQHHNKSGPRIDLQLGSAYEFGSVEIDGIGVGQGNMHVSFEQLGWKELFRGPDCPGAYIRFSTSGTHDLRLLSVCAASATVDEAKGRAEQFPNAVAEDMETYSVASSCQHLQVPLRVVRGISNLAGDRVQANWQSAKAMQSAVRLVINSIRS